MATNKVMVNDLIHFELEDAELRKLFEFFSENKCMLRMDCPQCGTTIVPQAKRYFIEKFDEEFNVSCINCGLISKVRMYKDYGFVLPTDDEFYKSGKITDDGWILPER